MFLILIDIGPKVIEMIFIMIFAFFQSKIAMLDAYRVGMVTQVY